MADSLTWTRRSEGLAVEWTDATGQKRSNAVAWPKGADGEQTARQMLIDWLREEGWNG